MKKLPSELGGLFYDGMDHNGLLTWFEAIKFKTDEEIKFKKLILEALGCKLKA